MLPTGVMPATVDSIFGDKVAVRISTNGRRVSNVPVVGATSRINTGDTIYLMQTAPNQYLAMSTKQAYGAGGQDMAYDHTHDDFLTLADVMKLLGGYALVSHTHPGQSTANLLQKPSPALVSPVAQSSYVGTTGCPGSYVDHVHNLPIDGTLQWTSACLGAKNNTVLSNAVPLIESGSGSPGSSASAARGDHIHPAFGGGSSCPAYSWVQQFSGSPSQSVFIASSSACGALWVAEGGLLLDPSRWTFSGTDTITLTNPLLANISVLISFYNGPGGVGGGGGVGVHNLLSTTHPDTTVASVSEGNSIVGRSGKWVSEAPVDIGSDSASLASINFIEQSVDIAAPGAGHSIFYLMSSGVAHIRSSAGSIYDLFVNNMTTLGDMIYGGASGAVARLAGNTMATRKFLRQVGDGSNSASPAWDILQTGDIPNLSGTYLTPAAHDVRDHTGVPGVGGGSGSGAMSPWKEITASTGGSPSFDFTSIPSTGRHLVIEIMIRGAKAGVYDNLYVQINGDAGVNYDYQQLYAYSSTVGAGNPTGNTQWLIGQPGAATAGAGLFSYFRIEIPYYANTHYIKTGIISSSELTSLASGSEILRQSVVYYNSSSAITEIKIYFAGGDIAEFSSASIYIIN